MNYVAPHYADFCNKVVFTGGVVISPCKLPSWRTAPSAVLMQYNQNTKHEEYLQVSRLQFTAANQELLWRVVGTSDCLRLHLVGVI